MERLTRALAAATAVCVFGSLGALPVFAQPAEYQSVRNVRGSITGVVSDDHGGPIAGALVSALGTVTVAKATTDAHGYFSIEALPLGDYTVHAHRSGFAGSARATVRVSSLPPALQRLQLRRFNAAVATSGSEAPVPARPIMAAGFAMPSGTLADQPDSSETSATDATKDNHPHTETAWRLRHFKRSILKDSAPIITVVERDTDIQPVQPGSIVGRAIDSAAGLATNLFTDLPFTGEVNLLTTGALGPDELFSGETLPRGVAYLSIGAPTPAGDWSVRAAMSQGDLSSWIVAGAFESRVDSAHAYRFGYSFSAQDYLGGNLAALAAATDGSRNVGELFAFDRWAIAPAIAVEYGARYGRYDYLRPGGLFSPRIGVSVEPISNLRVSATVAQRMVAPGAEEFVASETPGPWLPPERTFAPLGGPGDFNVFSVERARYVDVLVEHNLDAHSSIGVRRFYQNVEDQLVTLFGLNVPGGPQSVGHYYVANAGSLGADGWAVRVSHTAGKRVSGSIDYSVTRARWVERGDVADIAPWAPAAIRPESEDLHDVTTSLTTEIPETATRVFVFYKINTGYTRSDTSQLRPGLDARFDVQINQTLPFELAGTRWEVLLGLRNLFRDPNDPASVYDELLVVKPPKRVVGGFLVRF